MAFDLIYWSSDVLIEIQIFFCSVILFYFIELETQIWPVSIFMFSIFLESKKSWFDLLLGINGKFWTMTAGFSGSFYSIFFFASEDLMWEAGIFMELQNRRTMLQWSLKREDFWRVIKQLKWTERTLSKHMALVYCKEPSTSEAIH